ncbi:di-trans,poly-cis-decaprenylcistransferase [Candidatus Shapirobacteria bacterium]|nr:di-trans,poly-cis-decaprenylcistransferase [Candidatus Shapirobacteria bacterium]
MTPFVTKLKIDKDVLPKHIAIIMDGNRRWAKNRGLKSTDGHRQAALNTIEPIIEKCGELGIKYVTFWAFSTENWKRDEEELKGLFDVFRLGLANLAARFISKGANLRILGDINRFPSDIAKKALEMMQMSKKNDKIYVTFALNYGGRDEILRAVKKIVSEKIPVNEITDEVFSNHLDTAGIPDPDLIIRTGGEQRTSGYLPWQSVYAELCFVPVLFPDFSPEEFEKSIVWYQSRDRRLGK